MEYLTIREQEILAKMKEFNNTKIDFNIIPKLALAKYLDVERPNLYRFLTNLAKKGHINYENNCITYN